MKLLQVSLRLKTVKQIAKNVIKIGPAEALELRYEPILKRIPVTLLFLSIFLFRLRVYV